MWDVRVAELAARQHNRFSLAQLAELGVSSEAIRYRIAQGRWTQVHEGVFAIAPLLDDDLGRWMAATLTAPGSVLSHASAGAAWGWWRAARDLETITRHGSGGVRRIDGVLVHRSDTLDEDTTILHGFAITRVPRTLLDLAPHVGNGALARSVREAIRLQSTTAAEVIDALATRHRGRRGTRRLALTVARYTGLPVHKARSGSEVIALEILREAGRCMPELNRKVAGKEADLTWARQRVIVEIDGGPWHLDRGEDARKDELWRRAGFTVHRLPSDDLLHNPQRLLALAPNVHEAG